MENVLPFSTLYSRPDAFRHLPSSGALTCNCYRVQYIYIYIYKRMISYEHFSFERRLSPLLLDYLGNVNSSDY